MDHKSAVVEKQIMFVIQTLLMIGVSQLACCGGEDSAPDWRKGTKRCFPLGRMQILVGPGGKGSRRGRQAS